MAGTQETGVFEDDAGRKFAFADQRLGAIEVSQNAVEKLGALDDGGFDLRPFVTAENKRNGIERPGAGGAFGIAIDVVGNAVVMDEAEAFLPAFGQTFGAEVVERFGEGKGLGTGFAGGRNHFVIETRARLVVPGGIQMRTGFRRGRLHGNTKVKDLPRGPYSAFWHEGVVRLEMGWTVALRPTGFNGSNRRELVCFQRFGGFQWNSTFFVGCGLR